MTFEKSRNYFTDPKTGNFYRLGDTLSNPKLANALKIISKEGADAFYARNGTFTQKIVDEINNEGGIIKIEDLTNYKPKWGKPVESKLFTGDSLYTFPLPATGNIITFILNILNGFKIEGQSIDYHNENKLYYHRLIEAFKFAFAKRTKLGDETTEEVLSTLKELESLEFAENIRLKIDDDKTFDDFAHYGTNTSNVVDHGTGHISVLAPNGDAVALTSTINIV